MKSNAVAAFCLMAALQSYQPVLACQQSKQDPDQSNNVTSVGTEEENQHWKDVGNLVRKGDSLLYAVKNPEAIAVYKEVLALEPTTHDAYEGIGDADLSIGDFDAAVAEYKIAIKLYNAAINRFRLAVAYAHLGDYEGAVREYEVGLSSLTPYPENLDQIFGRSVSANAANMSTIETAVLAYRGHEFASHFGDNRAIPLYREAIRLSPRLAQLHLLLGYSLTNTHDLDGARASFEEAAALGNKDTASRASLMLRTLPLRAPTKDR